MHSLKPGAWALAWSFCLLGCAPVYRQPALSGPSAQLVVMPFPSYHGVQGRGFMDKVDVTCAADVQRSEVWPHHVAQFDRMAETESQPVVARFPAGLNQFWIGVFIESERCSISFTANFKAGATYILSVTEPPHGARNAICPVRIVDSAKNEPEEYYRHVEDYQAAEKCSGKVDAFFAPSK